MAYKYKIIEVNEAERSVVARFYSDDVPEADLAVNLDVYGNIVRARTDYNITIWPDPVPTGDALHAYIMQHCPTDFLDLQAKTKAQAQPALGALAALANQEQRFSLQLVGPQRVKMFTKLP